MFNPESWLKKSGYKINQSSLCPKACDKRNIYKYLKIWKIIRQAAHANVLASLKKVVASTKYLNLLTTINK